MVGQLAWGVSAFVDPLCNSVRLRFVQSSNVVYPALPSFFVISEIPWGRFREGNCANSSG